MDAQEVMVREINVGMFVWWFSQPSCGWWDLISWLSHGVSNVLYPMVQPMSYCDIHLPFLFQNKLSGGTNQQTKWIKENSQVSSYSTVECSRIANTYFHFKPIVFFFFFFHNSYQPLTWHFYSVLECSKTITHQLFSWGLVLNSNLKKKIKNF